MKLSLDGFVIYSKIKDLEIFQERIIYFKFVIIIRCLAAEFVNTNVTVTPLKGFYMEISRLIKRYIYFPEGFRFRKCSILDMFYSISILRYN